MPCQVDVPYTDLGMFDWFIPHTVLSAKAFAAGALLALLCVQAQAQAQKQGGERRGPFHRGGRKRKRRGGKKGIDGSTGRSGSVTVD